MIPKQLQQPDFRFCLLKPKDKIPFEKEWQKKGYKWNDEKLQQHIKLGGNYGVIGGYGNLIILDKDDEKLDIDLNTLTIETGSGGKHYYLISDYKTNHVFVEDLGELRANNYQVVGSGCTHPSGNKYKVVKDLEILRLHKNEVKELIKPYLRKEQTSTETDGGLSGKDTSRSGLEYRKAIAEFRKGKSRKQVHSILMAYKKFADDPEQYQETTLDNAEKFVLGEQEKKEQITFNYETVKQDVKTIEELGKIIKKNFSSIWMELRATLSVHTVMSVKSLNGCPALIKVGSPAGEKTTIDSFFYGQDNTYLSDDFTPKAFVSHSANVKSEDLEGVDLLPKLKNKILISPELAPLFEGQRDKLIENFSILTRVLDGEGLNRDSGVHGHRGYSGDYKFGWIGSTTPLKYAVWQVMGKIGNRLFFLNMREKNRTNKDYLEMFSGKAYEEKVKECRGAVRSFLDNFYKKYPLRSIEWDAEGDIFILQEIIKYAKLLSKLRASLMTWKGDEKGKYEHYFPIVEEPPRAINSLYNFAKGHALIHGRKFLKKEDLEIVRAIAFSSMPHDRSEFLKLLAKHEGKLTTTQIEKELNCSQDTALRTMKIFEILGVVTIKSINFERSSVGRPMKYIEINPEFSELLAHTQGLNDEINNKPDENKGVCDEYDDDKLIEIIKLSGKKMNTHQLDDEINNKSQKNNPVCDEKTEVMKNE